MRLSGHKTLATFLRYNIEDEQMLSEAGKKLSAFLSQQSQPDPGLISTTGTVTPRVVKSEKSAQIKRSSR
jgi:hypothetical protein